MEYKQGDIVVGYKILREYGSGGMSKVYLAENTNTNNKVSLLEDFCKYAIVKVISKLPYEDEKERKANDDQWKKALDEFNLTCALSEKSHENVARPINWIRSDDGNSIVILTEFIDGPSLNKFLSDQKALTVNKAIYYFKKIVEGVKFFHHLYDNKTIIHRDLKTDNIILTKDLREIKIIDYGIATSFYDNHFISAEGTIYCTANYTTPDVLNLNQKILDAASNGDVKALKKMKDIITVQFDFHSLGIILYEMLTGSFPFIYIKKLPDAKKIKMWLEYDLPIIRNQIASIPNSIENIIFRCVASKPSDIKFRYKNIDDLIKDIQTWDDPKRVDEPLLKPIELRVFQQKNTFDIKALKEGEPFYCKWWFYILLATSFAILVFGLIIIITFLFLGII